MAGTVKFTSRIKSWTDETEKMLDRAVLESVTDIHRLAVMIAPKQTRALVNSGRIKRIGLGHYAVIFGGGSIPYARRRHYENKRNPQTLRYLERAGDSVARGFGRYLK